MEADRIIALLGEVLKRGGDRLRTVDADIIVEVLREALRSREYRMR